jgi:hypothetical protein
MSEEKTTREMVYEISRDVKWLCKTLQRMEKRDEDFEQRLREVEGWKHRKTGEEQRMYRISAGAGGLVGGFVAVLVRVLGWG